MKIAVAFLNKNKKHKSRGKLEKILSNTLSTRKDITHLSKKEVKNRNYIEDTIRSLKYKGSKKINNRFNKIKPEIKLNKNVSISILVISIMIISFIKITGISPNIITFATNFRQADEKSINLLAMYKLYGIYNDNNYILADNRKNKKDKESKEINNNEQTNVEDDMYDNKNIYEILDSMCYDKKEEAVFSKNLTAKVTENSTNIQRISVGDMKILNYSSKRELNFDKILNENVTLTKASDKILLYSTHTSESYTNSENYKFEYSGTMRSQDPKYNMLAIAKELNNNLKDKGINSIHNTTPHDYGAYTGAYSKSRITVKNAIKSIGGAGISIDVHRDAVADLTYRPVVKIKGVDVAQCMFVMGVGNDTTNNPYYEDNLKLAIKMQRIADEIYPGLFKPMIIRDSVYNQDLNKYSLLIEVGATGNTIEEAMNTTRCLANLFNIVYKD